MAVRYLYPSAGGEPTHFEQDGWIYEMKRQHPVFHIRGRSVYTVGGELTYSIEGRNLVRVDSGRIELFFGE